MRFIRKEYIITTIFNKDLTKKDEILTVFKNLYAYRISFSMTMKKYMPLQHDYFNMSFEKVRIKEINKDETVNLLTFKGSVKTVVKNVPFDDIIEVNATTKKYKILEIDSDITRFDILDFDL